MPAPPDTSQLEMMMTSQAIWLARILDEPSECLHPGFETSRLKQPALQTLAADCCVTGTPW